MYVTGKLLGNTTSIKKGIEYDMRAVKYVARAIYLCISLVMEVERGRFYLIGLYLIVYWDVAVSYTHLTLPTTGDV